MFGEAAAMLICTMHNKHASICTMHENLRILPNCNLSHIFDISNDKLRNTLEEDVC